MDKLKFSRQVEWWQKNIIYRVRSLWITIATRFGIRKTVLILNIPLRFTSSRLIAAFGLPSLQTPTPSFGVSVLSNICHGGAMADIHDGFWAPRNGLKKLKNDVRTCEYEDIRVMWEMLNRNESLSEFGGNSPNKIKKMHHLKLFKWARCVAPYTTHSS